jgi:nitrous oxidase accessory protein
VRLRENIFIDNDIGIMIDAQSSGNLVYNNSFSDNNSNAQDQGTANSWNLPSVVAGTNILGGPSLGGNFWDDYVGADLNGDGIGDENLPYDVNGNIRYGGDLYPLVASP